jgi:hypothetical protein
MDVPARLDLRITRFTDRTVHIGDGRVDPWPHRRSPRPGSSDRGESGDGGCGGLVGEDRHPVALDGRGVEPEAGS